MSLLKLVALCQAVEERYKCQWPAQVWATAAKRGDLDGFFGIEAVRRRGRPPGVCVKHLRSRFMSLPILLIVKYYEAAEREVGFRGDPWPIRTQVFNETRLEGWKKYTEGAFKKAYQRAKRQREEDERQGYDLAALLRDWWQPPLPPRVRALKPWLQTRPWRSVPPPSLGVLALITGLACYVEEEEARALRSRRGARARALREAAGRKDLSPAERAWRAAVHELFGPQFPARERELREDFKRRWQRKREEGRTVTPIEVIKESGAALGLRLRPRPSTRAAPPLPPRQVVSARPSAS